MDYSLAVWSNAYEFWYIEKLIEYHDTKCTLPSHELPLGMLESDEYIHRVRGNKLDKLKRIYKFYRNQKSINGILIEIHGKIMKIILATYLNLI